MDPRRTARRIPLAATLAAGFLALAAGLAGCAPDDEEAMPAPAPARSAPEAGAGQAPEAPEAPEAQGTQAPPDHAALTEALDAELGRLAASEESLATAAVVQAFVTAGFPEASVEVSPDRTPTGLDVDSIQAAAVQDGACIFGEVRDGSASVTVLPVLSGGDCFVGD